MQDDLRSLLRKAVLTSVFLHGVCSLTGCDRSSTEGPQDDTSARAPVAGLASSGGDGDAGEPDAPSDSPADDLLSTALDERDPFARVKQLAFLLPTLGEAAAPTIRAVLTDPARDLDPGSYDLLLRTWTRLEPEAAASWAFASATSMYRLFSTRTVIETWAAADPATALVTVDSALMGLATIDPQLVSIAEHALVRGWFRKDHDEAERFVVSLGSGVKRQRALMALALARVEAEGADAAIAWAEATDVADARYRMEAFQQTLAALSVVDMPAAIRFCDAHCDGPWAQGLRSILSRMRLSRGEDGAAVLEWIASSAGRAGDPPSAETNRSLRTSFGMWSRMAPERALPWMEEQLEADSRPAWLGALIGEYARQIATRSTAEAIRWAEQVPDESERLQTLVRIGRHWIRTDEAAAEAWLRQSQLPQETQTEIRDRTATIYLPNLTEEPNARG